MCCCMPYRDTERIEEVRTLIDGHCEVILSTSVDSPCDQRVLRYLSKTFPQFDEVEVFVALACEAGSRSLGCLVSAMVISPLKTESFSIRSIHGKSKSACLFCDECSFPDKSVQCPVSSCPIGKTDGPCQNRTSEGCVVDEGERCVWLDVPVLVPVSQKVSIPSENSLSFPAFLIPSPDSLKDSGKLVSFLKNKNVSTLFVAPSENGISPLVLIGILKEMMEGVTFGLCLNGSDKNDIALASDLVTAAALGVEYIFLKEYHRPTSRKMAYSSTVELIELIKEKNESFTIIVGNAFLHESDFFLLDTQIEGGASLVVSSLVTHV